MSLSFGELFDILFLVGDIYGNYGLSYYYNGEFLSKKSNRQLNGIHLFVQYIYMYVLIIYIYIYIYIYIIYAMILGLLFFAWY